MCILSVKISRWALFYVDVYLFRSEARRTMFTAAVCTEICKPLEFQQKKDHGLSPFDDEVIKMLRHHRKEKNNSIDYILYFLKWYVDHYHKKSCTCTYISLYIYLRIKSIFSLKLFPFLRSVSYPILLLCQRPGKSMSLLILKFVSFLTSHALSKICTFFHLSFCFVC